MLSWAWENDTDDQTLPLLMSSSDVEQTLVRAPSQMDKTPHYLSLYPPLRSEGLSVSRRSAECSFLSAFLWEPAEFMLLWGFLRMHRLRRDAELVLAQLSPILWSQGSRIEFLWHCR